VARQLCAKDEQLMERVKPLLELAESASTEVRQGKQEEQGEEGEGEAEAEAEGERDEEKGNGKIGPPSDMEKSILEMEKRLKELQDKHIPSTLQPLMPAQQGGLVKVMERNKLQMDVCEQLQGWQVAPQDWKPTPIGCLNGSVPNLLL